MTNIYGRSALGGLWDSIQSWLFPMLEDEIGELDAKPRQFVAVCELCAPQNHMVAYHWIGNGCPSSDRLALCKVFIAKAVWDFATTRDLIDALRHRPALRRLCGWETLGGVPSEATFSRAFDDFASDNLPQKIHVALLKESAVFTARTAASYRKRCHRTICPKNQLQNPSRRTPQAGYGRGFARASSV